MNTNVLFGAERTILDLSARFACEHLNIKPSTSMRSTHATPRAVQRITFSRSLGKHSMTIPPSRGRKVMSDNNGNMPLSPHRIIDDNQYNTQQDRQRIIAHIAGLQAAQ